MYQFFVTKEQIGEGQAVIAGSDVNHIRNVLRMKPGEEVRISDGERIWQGVLAAVGAESVTVSLREEAEDHELPLRIVLFQGMPKADKLETVIQKSVELGVSEVVPVMMKRSIVKLDEKKRESRQKRWQMIAESAAKQAKRDRIPEVREPVSYREALEYAQTLDVRLLPYENAYGMEQTRRILTAVRPGMSAGILIGPEGGFEEAEVALAEKLGWQTISLGKRILRTETAGPALLAMLAFCLE